MCKQYCSSMDIIISIIIVGWTPLGMPVKATLATPHLRCLFDLDYHVMTDHHLRTLQVKGVWGL